MFGLGFTALLASSSGKADLWLTGSVPRPTGNVAKGRDRVKTRRNFANDRAEQDFSRFFHSERSKAP